MGSTVHQVISAILNMHKLAVWYNTTCSSSYYSELIHNNSHGDLKRDNLLIRGGAVVLADFGLSGFLNRAKGIPQSKWPQFSFSIGRYQDCASSLIFPHGLSKFDVCSLQIARQNCLISLCQGTLLSKYRMINTCQKRITQIRATRKEYILTPVLLVRESASRTICGAWAV